ncbi:unnamed protein product [Paramecium sonneborni]|uniref:Uncharacterized protein n=1 Tax=Paramecium sonneborni TaxID=65129 RepID=A0A8S1QK15_9CILI|nr:unnamed protein product [Paramecium sonneborni]
MLQEEEILIKMDKKQVCGQKQRILEGQSLQFYPVYFSPTIIFQQGIYNNGMKIGKWEIKSQKNIIGGGNYNERGLKFGQWVEMYDKYWELDNQYKFNQVLLSDVSWKLLRRDQNRIMGNSFSLIEWYQIYVKNQFFIFRDYGRYDKNGMKEGLWTELSETFWDKSQIFYKGKYKNGIKCEKWNAYYYFNKRYELIDGDWLYKKEGKFGEWIVWQEFSSYLYIIYVGTYSNVVKKEEFSQQKFQQSI